MTVENDRVGYPVRRIALFAPDYSDYVHRLVHGMATWQSERPGILLEQYRFEFRDLGDLEKIAERGDAPPWKGRADGVVAYVGAQPGLSEWLRRGEVPVVNMSADRPPGEIPAVHGDGQRVAELALDHLLETGFRSFAYVGCDQSPGSNYREQSFAAAVQRRGREMVSCHVLAKLDGPVQAAARLLAVDPRLQMFLRKLPKPVGVFCQNDHYAAGVCAAAQKIGLRVPADVGVVGVGDGVAARESEPSITSVRLPAEKIGYEAIRLLNRLISGMPAPTEPRTIPPSEIARRESTCDEGYRDCDLERAVRMIRDRACEGIDIGDVLVTLQVSRKTFERRFCDIYGHPPGEEIRRIRLKQAYFLLATTSLPVGLIGRMVGYPRPSMFARFFKTRCGQTPRQYRCEVRSNSQSFLVRNTDANVTATPRGAVMSMIS